MERAKRLRIDRHPIFARASPLKHLLGHLFHLGPNEQSSDAKHALMSECGGSPIPSYNRPTGDIWTRPIAPGIIIQSAPVTGNCLDSGVGNCWICTAFFFKNKCGFRGYQRPTDARGPSDSADVSEHRETGSYQRRG